MPKLVMTDFTGNNIAKCIDIQIIWLNCLLQKSQIRSFWWLPGHFHFIIDSNPFSLNNLLIKTECHPDWGQPIHWENNCHPDSRQLNCILCPGLGQYKTCTVSENIIVNMSVLRNIECIANVALLFLLVENTVASELLEATFIPYVSPTG